MPHIEEKTSQVSNDETKLPMDDSTETGQVADDGLISEEDEEDDRNVLCGIDVDNDIPTLEICMFIPISPADFATSETPNALRVA
jgi:hypothetical protein